MPLVLALILDVFWAEVLVFGSDELVRDNTLCGTLSTGTTYSWLPVVVLTDFYRLLPVGS